jgi:hypothetical protein
MVQTSSNTHAYDSSGSLITSLGSSASCAASAAIGTASAGPYLYFAGSNGSAIRRWDGSAFSAPAGMPNAAYLAVQPADNRLVAANTSTSQVSRVKFSGEGTPETWGADDFVDLHPNDGEEILALVTWREMLFAFKQTKFFVFYGNSVDEVGGTVFNYRSVLGEGCTGGHGAVAGPDGVYFANGRGVWKTTGGPAQLLPGLGELFGVQGTGGVIEGPGNPFFLSGIGAASASHLTFWQGNLLMVLSVNSTRYLLVRTANGEWTLWSLPAVPAHIRTLKSASNPDRLFFPYATGGNHVGMMSGTHTSDDSTLISSYWRSAFFDLGIPNEKAIREAIVWGTGTIGFSKARDHGSLGSETALTLGTDPAVVSNRDRRAIRGTTLSFKMSGTAGWQVNRVQLNFRPPRVAGIKTTS